MTETQAELKFWGVRGGLPAPGAETAVFGGNSACIEIDCGDQIVVFDAGTGLRVLGQSLMARSPVRGDLLFSHTNFNRICGLPFFAAAFHPKNAFGFWCGHVPEEGSIEEVLTRLMTDPVFPVPIGIFNADLSFHDFQAGNSLEIGAIDVATMPITSGLPGTAYRLTCPSATICYACGIKPESGLDMLVDFASGTDLLIMSLVGDNGPETDQLALEIARNSGAGQLYLTDHGPTETDESLVERERKLQKTMPSCRLAREGETIDLTRLRQAAST